MQNRKKEESIWNKGIRNSNEREPPKICTEKDKTVRKDNTKTITVTITKMKKEKTDNISFVGE
jgi:hypothetical protein